MGVRNTSPELRVLLEPAAAFRQLGAEQTGGLWVLLRRPLALVFVCGCVVSLLASGAWLKLRGGPVQTLVTGPGEAKVTCLPDFGMPLGQHWASLATVLLDPVDRTARVLDGTPAEHATHRWYELRA